MCIYSPNSNNFKISKSQYLKNKLCVRVVKDYADTQFSNFAIEYLHENLKIRETVFVCSYGPRSNILSKKWSKISWHCPFKAQISKFIIAFYITAWTNRRGGEDPDDQSELRISTILQLPMAMASHGFWIPVSEPKVRILQGQSNKSWEECSVQNCGEFTFAFYTYLRKVTAQILNS